MEVAETRQEVDRTRGVGANLKEVEECRFDSSAYEGTGLFVDERSLLVRRRKTVGDRAEP